MEKICWIFSFLQIPAFDHKVSSSDKDNLKKQVNMVIIGHVDAGKSTLMGHLLYKFGVIDASRIHKN